MELFELRNRAEERLRGLSLEPIDVDPTELHRELGIYAIEIELQNEELHRIEVELRGTAERYSRLFHSAPFAHLVVEDGAHIVEVNRAAEAMLRSSRDELVGRALPSMMSERDAERVHLHIRESLQGGTEQKLEVRLRRSDGSELPAMLDSIPLEERACLTSIVDLTIREGDEAQACLRELTDQLDDVFFVIDLLRVCVLYVSPGIEALFGRSPSEALDPKTDLLEWVHPADRAKLIEAVRAFGEGARFDVEHKIVQRSGGTRIVRTRLIRVCADDRRAVGVVCDVTEQRLLEAELRQIQKLDAIGALASGIAHDFNNMLMGLIGFATVALQRLDPTHPSYPLVKRTVDIAGRGKMLTRHLLDFSRKRHVERAPLDLDSVIADCRPLLETLAGDHIEVTVRAEALGCRIHGDAAEIEQIMMNLATNARDAMPNGGVLEITTQEMLVRPDGNRDLPPGRYAEIVVRDTGCGIDQPTLSRIFEPFFTTKLSGGGTGLGLSNIQAIAQRMGGRVFIASTVGVGTTVTILLPIVPETSEIPMPREYGRESTILVVEDDPNVRTTVAHYIEDLGYRSLVAANAMEAKRIAHERGDRIDVLLTDVMLPQQLGTDLAREIRDELPNVQVAFMSAHEREELVDRNRIDPEAPLLQKPFDQRALARILNQLLET